jgi:hypothetical protein
MVTCHLSSQFVSSLFSIGSVIWDHEFRRLCDALILDVLRIVISHLSYSKFPTVIDMSTLQFIAINFIGKVMVSFRLYYEVQCFIIPLDGIPGF